MKIVIKCIEHDDYGKEIEEVNNEIELSSIRFEENEEYIEPDDERFPISTHDYIDKFIGDAQTIITIKEDILNAYGTIAFIHNGVNIFSIRLDYNIVKIINNQLVIYFMHNEMYPFNKMTFEWIKYHLEHEWPAKYWRTLNDDSEREDWLGFNFAFQHYRTIVVPEKIIIDGSIIDSKVTLYCELGEQFLGPGGYMGLNLDAFDDMFYSFRNLHMPKEGILVWKHFHQSLEIFSADYIANIEKILSENNFTIQKIEEDLSH